MLKKVFINLSFVLPIVCLAIFCISCKDDQSHSSENRNTNQVIIFDSIRRVEIDTLVAHINMGLREVGMPQKLVYPKYHPTDTIYYWVVDSQSARISLELNLPQEIVWPTFFVHNGQLVMVRYRYASDIPEAREALECIIYLDKDEIIYAVERGTKLEASETPGMMRQLPHSKSMRSKDELEKLYIDHWQTIISYLQEHKRLPGFLAHYL